MQNNPQMTLNRLKRFSTTENPKYRRLYPNLYSVDFYKLAYSNIYSKPGNMTEASDGSTIDGMSIQRIEKLIQSLKDGTYRPTNLRRVNIPKKNGGTRPISIPSFDDKLVQEVIRMILEAIYEDSFSDYSHGFRPNRSCHTALTKVRQQFQGTVWFIEGDIKGCFDNINHEILLKILRERIYDLRFIHLINLFLKAGYIENWQYHKTYSGTPQGSIISPILSNIFLDKFDKFMEETKNNFDVGKRRKANRDYHRIIASISYKKKKLDNNKELTEEDKTQIRKEIQDLRRQHRNFKGSVDDVMDPDYKRLHYVRYADDFIIGVVGSKKDAEEINTKIKNFLTSHKLELSPDKHKITHASEKIRFLGYDIIKVRHSQKKEENGNIRLSVPYDKMIQFVIDGRYAKWWNNPKSGKDELKGIHRPEMIHIEPIEMLHQYNASLRGLYNYYSLAENVYKIAHFGYLLQLSFLRTLASKYRTSCAKLYKNKKYCQHKRIGVIHPKTGKFVEFFVGPFEKKLKNKNFDDLKPINNKHYSKNSLIKRLEANKCEFCGDTEGPFEVHHVHKLKDLKGKANWERLMISRHRKTLVLCVSCHDKLHAGKL